MATSIEAILVANISDFKAKMAEAGVTVEGLKKESSGAFQGLSSIGKGALLGIAGAAVAVGAVSLDMGVKFQKAMELIHTQAGASQAEVNKLSGAVLNLAGPTATAPEELAAGLYHLESQGLRGAKAMDALKVAAEGAKVGNANLEDVTNALGAIIASNIGGVKNLSGAMGAMNAIVGAGDMRMQDLADVMSTGVIAQAAKMGVTLQQAGAAIAVFGDNNIRGAQAGTELRMALMAIAQPAKGGAAALKELGLTTSSLADTMRTGGLPAAIKLLHDRLVATGNDGNTAGEILTQAFGKKAGVGITVLASEYDKFQQKIEAVNKGAGTFGEAWKATTHTLSFQMDQAKATAEALATKLGEALIPKLEELMKTIMGVVVWFEHHKDVAMALAVAVGTVLVAAVAAYTVSMASAAIATIAATWPILAIIAAVALVAVGIYELATHWHQVWTDIKNWVADAVEWIKGHLLIVMAIPIVGWLLVLAANWKTVFEAIKVAVTDAWAVIQPIFDFIKSYIVGQIQVTITIFQGIWDVAWTAISTSVHVAWDVISVIFAAINFAIGAVQTVINALKDAWDAVWGAVKAAVSDAWSFIQPILSTMQSTINAVASALHTISFGLIGGGGGALPAPSNAPLGSTSGMGGNLGHKAAGGPVSAMTPYLVGEQGPELFVPSSAGSIVPNSALGGGGGMASVQLVLNGRVLGTALVPILQSAFLQAQRSQVSLGFN